MKKHLYNSRLGKVRWFVDRFGASELFLKPLRVVFGPILIPLVPSGSFVFQGQTLGLYYHKYNMTWVSERGLEVPIARSFVAQYPADSVLEVGNVLSHYSPVGHDILDKFERAPGVINEDIVSFQPKKSYQLIISISTFEHIGFDDDSEGSSASKIQEAVLACRKMLAASGKLVTTIPVGYNPELDELLRQEALPTTRETYLRRYAPREWRECPKAEALQCKYKDPHPYANAVGVLEFGSLSA